MAKQQVQKVARELLLMGRDVLAAKVALATDANPLAHISDATERWIVSRLMVQVR